MPPSIKVPAIGDAHHAAPGAFANQRSKAGFAEHGREDVAVRGGVLVEQADHRADEDAVRILVGFLVGARVIEPASNLRRRRSISMRETLPPPLARTSTINPSFVN